MGIESMGTDEEEDDTGRTRGRADKLKGRGCGAEEVVRSGQEASRVKRLGEEEGGGGTGDEPTGVRFLPHI